MPRRPIMPPARRGPLATVGVIFAAVCYCIFVAICAVLSVALPVVIVWAIIKLTLAHS